MGGASKLLMLLSTPFPLLYPRPAALRLARPSRFPLSRFSTASSSFSFPFTPIPPSASAPRPQAADPANSPYIARESWDLPASFTPRPTHPWPEWSRLVDHLTAGGYSSRQIRHAGVEDDDSFAVYEKLPGEFVRAAEMCLSFARAQPDALRLLSKKDIEVVVENGSPSLFKNGANSARRMRSFISGQTVWESEKAETVDIMRYLLSHVCHPLVTSVKNSVTATEPTEASARNLLNELVNVIGNVRQTNFTVPTPRQTPLTQEQFSSPPGQNIEMKKGDWICQRCSFMNFARNVRCRECDEGRPKRELTGREWECPQCEFFNFRRNVSCLRCDCKRPGDAPAPVTDSGYGRNPSFEQTLDRRNMDESEIKRKLAANDEKAERWFSKVGQLDDASDLSRDEDFPEIMPLRKGVNRFVVSTRKTPLERRLASSQYGSNSLNDGATDRNTESSINESLDRILGRSSSSSGATDKDRRQGDPDHVPFVPLPADMFSKSTTPDSDMSQSSPKPSQLTNSASTISETPTRTKIDNESADASERWSKTVAELDDVTNMADAISDEDFPEIMPMRKGENRFVVSKKKDRSLTSPQYKRRLAMEQANSSNFVPFVPFPPDYFAKKDKKPEAMVGDSTPGQQVNRVAEKPEETKTDDYNPRSQMPDSRMVNNDGKTGGSYGGYNAPRPSQQGQALQSYGSGYNAPRPSQQGKALQGESQKYSGTSLEGSIVNSPRSSQQGQALQSYGESWKYSGTSLEGSAVKETDPLDMSEEAKAERWFRRAAQIKDIDELSQIPDEDFPEIMPMRKGVNRFVVSKRKTPLERRLTSPQYRRNLPTVSSEPEKDDK